MTVDSAPAAQIRRTELSTFLRTRRERLDPTELGLPPGTRRRTPGLRREEVAQLAGVGVTWYTWLEQGRRINASTQVLDAIAKTLRLDQTEHEHLYRLADVPGLMVRSEPESSFEPGARRILDEIKSPAFIGNERYDVLAWNSAYRDLFPFRFTGSTRLRNTLWCVFTMPSCCGPVINADQELPMMVATFRASYSRHVGEPAWEELIAELSAASAKFREMWADHNVAGHVTLTKRFRHHAVGELTFTSVSMQLQATPGNRIVVYLPADVETTEMMRRLAEGSVPVPARLPCGHPNLPGNSKRVSEGSVVGQVW
ncbi:MAG TPA: helix-turn-helix transcriptional regulator [Actinocrinis sp.]|nr:helix-turn-helix transcriptional regulator [Actinocrinis sp.]